MPINYKVLGQSIPAATTDTDLYIVPMSTEAVVSTMTITNVTGTAGVARVYVRQGAATAATSNALMYDVPVAANSVNAFTLGLTLAAGDVVTVYSSNGSDLTFQLFGSEIS